MALVYLLSFPLMFVYFLHKTLSSLKISSVKNKINHQNEVICSKRIYNKWLVLTGKKIEDSIKDGLIITITTTGILYVLKTVTVKPPKVSITFQSLRCHQDRWHLVDHCILKAQDITHNIATGLWSTMPLSTALPLPWRVLLVLERVSIHNPNFVDKKSSHIT